MMAAILLREHPGTTIVTDSITSTGLAAFIRKHGGVHHRFRRGYKNVINESIRLNESGTDSQLAIETSGHAALKENYFLDDGAYLATKIVIKTAQLALEGKTLDSLISDLREPAEAVEIRIPIQTSEFGPYGDKILQNLVQFAEESPDMTVVTPNYEGVRIAFEEGWCLLRKSLHDPILPLNIESEKEGGCRKISDKLYAFLSDYDRLDLSPFEGC